MEKNKVTSYLLYAIGEIVLVVAGILIAVQIDDWNENRKSSNIEIEILKGIQSDLVKNEQRIMYMMSYDSMIVKKNNALLKVLNDKSSIYNDSLSIYFADIFQYSTFFPQRMGYENLKTYGLDIIKNDSLRLNIIELFEETYSQHIHIGERKSQASFEANRLLNKYLYTINFKRQRIPSDFEAIKENQEIKNVISYLTEDRRAMGYQSIYMLDKTKLLINSINKEIEN